MALRAVLQFLCALGVFHKGVTSLIETQQTVMAAVGEEAQLNCQLMQSKDVLQVTWQKLLPDGEKNLATYSNKFGKSVNPDFRNNVEFKCAGLQNSSIVIRKVTEQDEGCYLCLFNIYPEGALTAITCLLLYELHEAILHVGESNSPEEAVVSCSATGRPAPTVTLTVPHHNSSSVTNTNGTVTVTTTAVLPRLHGNSTRVGCAVRVLSSPQIEVFTMIPEIRQPSADGFDEESETNNSDRSRTWIILPVVLVACVCVVAAVIITAIMLRQKNHNSLSHREVDEMSPTAIHDTINLSHRDSEENKTDNTSIQEPDEVHTCVVTQDNQIRKRTPPEKSPTSDKPEPSPSILASSTKARDPPLTPTGTDSVLIHI
ncbi:OX-2 membrane glycoprotein-like isoform X2 [Perca fluviatilis]|nr:OX-2 membrane glycoprotein-like isoform X2 [Perca fluviatilis]